jgi:hypothetical protein
MGGRSVDGDGDQAERGDRDADNVVLQSQPSPDPR